MALMQTFGNLKPGQRLLPRIGTPGRKGTTT
jgi:hypothetical protein